MSGSKSRALGVLVLLAFVAMALLPLAWCIYASLIPEAVLFSATGAATASQAASTFSLASYGEVLFERAFHHALKSSLLVATATTALALSLAAPCAYALARLRLPGQRLVLAAVLAVSMFPQVSIVGPLFLLLKELGLVDTYPGLVLPYVTFAMPLAVWLLVAFFRQLPKDLEEQALMDGASRLRVLTSIILPLMVPGLATAGILTFVYCWNELLFALSFTVTPEHRTAPVAITMLRGQHQVPWGQILAASVLATGPVALLVVVFQRWIVHGLIAGAVKG